MDLNKLKKEEFYNKIIIVDFDDTLCIHPEHDKSDIESGVPNFVLVNELNRLFNLGYQIHIYTARGHLSTNSREEAEIKYRPIIEKWLRTCGVNYNLLSFNKPYGVMYIDDKAVRQDEFEFLRKLT